MTVTIVITNPPRRRIALLVLRARLKLEILIPQSHASRTGKATMWAARHWGFTGKTRKQALEWVQKELAQ